MQSITLKSRVGSDGLLKIHLPEAMNTEIEVILVYQIQSQPSQVLPKSGSYGCVQDELFIRQPQPRQPEREAFE